MLEKIYWKDICAITGGEVGWSSKDTLLKEAQTLYNLVYETVGYVIAETDEFVVVAATRDHNKDDEMFHDASMIMKSVITKRERI